MISCRELRDDAGDRQERRIMFNNIDRPMVIVIKYQEHHVLKRKNIDKNIELNLVYLIGFVYQNIAFTFLLTKL